jgi:hypothetical protein
MCFDEMAHDGEPQAQAAVPSRGRAVSLLEPLEHAWQKSGLDALARISDDDLCS